MSPSFLWIVKDVLAKSVIFNSPCSVDGMRCKQRKTAEQCCWPLGLALSSELYLHFILNFRDGIRAAITKISLKKV